MSGGAITRQTREAGHQAILPFIDAIRARVLDALRSNPAGLTAREVQAITGDSLNSVRSRLTEATIGGEATVIGKRSGPLDQLKVSVWRAA